MPAEIQTIIDDFEFLDEWEERYRYLIELGRDLTEISDDQKNASTKVKGCVSQVWLITKPETGSDPVIHFEGDSDAHIVKGLVAVMLALYSGKHASEIIKIDAEAIMKQLGLDEHLTPQRANGLRAMVARIKDEAGRLLSSNNTASAVS